YIRWAQIAANDANWRFISLTDGKQPMFVWLMMPLFKFVHDPLLAGRLVSVGAGFGTLLGLFFLSKELFKNKWIGLVTSLVYVLYPFALVYDRMALYDTLVGTFAVWSLYVAILLVRRVRLDIAFILAIVLGAAELTKTNGFFSAALVPATLILFDWQKKNRTERLVKWAFFAILAIVIAHLYYSILRLSPFFHIIDEKNRTFAYPFQEWIHHPLKYAI